MADDADAKRLPIQQNKGYYCKLSFGFGTVQIGHNAYELHIKYERQVNLIKCLDFMCLIKDFDEIMLMSKRKAENNTIKETQQQQQQQQE